MKFRIRYVDEHGYCGRDHHPSPSDKGLVVTAIAMVSEVYDTENGYVGRFDADDLEDAETLRKVREHLDHIEQVWVCVTEDGRVLQLMGHELSVA